MTDPVALLSEVSRGIGEGRRDLCGSRWWTLYRC